MIPWKYFWDNFDSSTSGTEPKPIHQQDWGIFCKKICVAEKHTVLGCAWCAHILQQGCDTSTRQYKVVSSTFYDRSTCGTQHTSTNVKFDKNAVFCYFVVCLLCNNHNMLRKYQELSHISFFIKIMYLHTQGTL